VTVQETVERILLLRKLGAKNGTDYRGVERRLLKDLCPTDVAEAAYQLHKAEGGALGGSLPAVTK